MVKKSSNNAELNTAWYKFRWCFFRGKTSVVCGPHLQTSVAEEVNQISAVCRKKTVCFSTSTKYHLKFNT
ncbi:hypothetical protein Hanom_Chr06g00531181 [Helianthus anomalus]